MTDEELHVEARKIIDAIKVLRSYDLFHQIVDKKLLRYNDIVACARRYEHEGCSIRAGLKEAIECCLIGNEMHVPGRGPLTLLEPFSLSANH